MSSVARFLGFAFANADFLFETDDRGTILFAAGAANDLVQQNGAALVGRPAAGLFKPSESAKFQSFAGALKTGGRAGPFKLTLAGGAEADLSLFRLDNGGAISCTLSLSREAAPAVDPRTGLVSREGFMAVAEKASARDSLTLVDVPGLPELCAQLPPADAQKLMQQIGELLSGAGASAAGQLSETRFGALSPAAKGPLGLARKIAAVLTLGGLKAPAIAETSIGLEGVGLSTEQRLLSLRYVIDRFAEKGKAGQGDIAASFGTLMDETQARLADMTRTVNGGDFEIAYQPIVELATGRIAHYEALARFTRPEGTGETVKFIEALGIANALDLAVASKVLGMVEQGNAHVAFNVSGHTIASPVSFGMLATLLARKRMLAPRVLIEITETAAIADLESAGKALASLRAMGYRVGLDDFGAGAASLNYLHAFPIDFVKFDGAMIRKIGASRRDDALLAGLAKLCGEMGVFTIAEWIETEAMAKAVREMGFTQGQGKWLGAPCLDIAPEPLRPGKRKGVRESWG